MFHQTIIAGNLGADPEIRTTGNGTTVATLRVAVNERWRDKDGEQKEHTEWYTCTLFGKLAELAEEYMKKGKPVMLIGRMRTEKFEGRDGEDKYFTKLIVNEMKFLPDGNGGGRDRDRDDDRRDRGRDRDDRRNSRDRDDRRRDDRNERGRDDRGGDRDSGKGSGSTGSNKSEQDDFDDDIPF